MNMLKIMQITYTNVLLVLYIMIPVMNSQNLTLPPLMADDLNKIISANISGFELGSSLRLLQSDSAPHFSPVDYTPNFFFEGVIFLAQIL